MKALFAGKDLEIMNSLVPNPSCRPAYEFLKGVLVWPDERADGLTPEAYKNLCALWVARSFLYHGRKFADAAPVVDPEFYKDVWQRGLAQVSSWPGFKRLELSEEDKTYFETARTEEATATDY